MRAVVQRVKYASVTVNNEVVGKIEQGLLVFVGVGADDTKEDAEILAQKCAKLRIFQDENEKMNLSVQDINGGILAISQFTLFADTKKGNRPSFTNSAPPKMAQQLYEVFIAELKAIGIRAVETGVFGAHMAIDLLNDGPVTIQYDTREWIRR